MTLAETALERQLSTTIMRGGSRPRIKRLRPGEILVEQGAPGRELYLLLDGTLTVVVDGVKLTELGPGAILGERAVLEGGRRTATLTALTDCTVAVADPGQVDRAALIAISEGHRREGPPT
jgi:CRP-like cAMP-binding protein